MPESYHALAYSTLILVQQWHLFTEAYPKISVHHVKCNVEEELKPAIAAVLDDSGYILRVGTRSE